RPARLGSPGMLALRSGFVTARLHEPSIHGHVLIHHPLDAEARDRPFTDAPAIQFEHARQIVDHLFEIGEDASRNAFVHDLADGSAIERSDWSAARHRFGEDEPERLARLNRVEQRARAAVQLYFGGVVRLAVVDDARAVD